MNIGQYGFDISKKSINGFIKNVSKIEWIKENLLIMLNLQYDYEDIQEAFNDHFFYSDDILLAIYYGMTRQEYFKKL